MNAYQMIIPILTPILIALVKWGVPRVPGKWLPVLAPVIGGLLDAGTAWATGTQANPGLAAALGSAGVGVREILDQWKKGTNGTNGTNGNYAFALAVVVGMTGCASMHTKVVETDFDGSERITEMSVRTFFDGSNEMTKFKSTNTDKTQSVGVDGVSQQTSGTNAAAMAGMIVERAVEGAVKAATGK